MPVVASASALRAWCPGRYAKEEENMKSRLVLAVIVATPFLGCASGALAQSAKSVVGTYSGVSFVTTDASGKSTPTFGDKPRAMMVLTPEGHYSIIVIRAGLPKFAANS